MIDLDQPVELSGASLYADHADPTVFHLLPGPPRVRTAALTLWRGAVSGGRLDLTLDLAHPPATRAAIDEALRRRGARAVPALLTSGTSTLHVPDTVAVRVAGSARVGDASPWSLLYSVALDAEMATLVEATAGRGLPMIVVASVTYTGLLQARRARIEAEAKACQEALQQRFALESLWLRSRREAAIESLIQSGQVHITDLATAVEDPLTRALDLRVIATDLLSAELWRPEPIPASPDEPNAGGSPSGALVGVGMRLREVSSAAERHLSWDLTASVPVDRTVHAQAYVDTAALTVQHVDLDQDPFFLDHQPLRVLVPDGADWTGVTQLLVDVANGESAGAAILTPEHHSAEVGVPGPRREVRIRVVATPDPADLVARLPTDTTLTVDGDVLLLDPAALAGRRTLDVDVLAPGDGVALDGEVRLTAGDVGVALRLDGPAQFVLWGADSVDGEVRIGLTPTGGARVETVLTRRLTRDETRWVVAPPEDGIEALTFGLADPLARYAAVIVEIADPPRVLRLSADTPFAHLARVNPTTRLRYRVRRVGHDGRDTLGDWVESETRVHAVGDPELRLARISVLLRDAGEHLGGVLHLENRKAPAGVPPGVDMSIDAGARLVDVPLATGLDGRWAGAVEVTVFDADGGVRTGRVDVEDEELVLVRMTPATA